MGRKGEGREEGSERMGRNKKVRGNGREEEGGE